MMCQKRVYVLAILLLMINLVWGQKVKVQEILDKRINRETVGGNVVVDGRELFSQIELVKFYANRNYEQAWLDQKNVKDLIESLHNSVDEGLIPEDYHLEKISHLYELDKRNGLSDSQMADLDLLLTDALILYASHLLEGKLEQSELRREWDVDKNERPKNIDSLLTVTLHNNHIKSALEKVKPDHQLYRGLKVQLKKLRSQAQIGAWPQISPGEVLKPGERDSRVTALRNHLIAVGDLKNKTVIETDLFDKELEEAVKKYQYRHKLTVDGIVGQGTIKEMNVPIEVRIDMIRLNLERLRWIFQQPDDDFLMVNIAGFRVKRIRERKEVFDSRVIVGKYHRESPIFKGVMKYIVINPTWTLPYSIATRETLPHLQKDPGYLADKHMEVMDRNGKILNPDLIDWGAYSAGNFPFVIRQKAGPWNALGEVKFMFPNKYSVYLHDTPSRGLFNQQDRAFSHGCIRTEDKWGLLMSLMDDPDVWNMKKIDEILKSGKTTNINLPQPINIYLIYLTASVDQDNNLIFMRDVYQRDKAVLKALDQPFWH